MKTEDKAKRVLEVFPSFHELMNSESMNFLIEHRIMNPMAVFAFRNSQEWEGIAIAVQNMCMSMQGRPFDDGYCFPNNKEKGIVKCYPAYGEPLEITSLTVYKALLICMFCSWMNIGVFSLDENYLKTHKKEIEEQSKAYYSFLDSPIVCSILD